MPSSTDFPRRPVAHVARRLLAVVVVVAMLYGGSRIVSSRRPHGTPPPPARPVTLPPAPAPVDTPAVALSETDPGRGRVRAPRVRPRAPADTRDDDSHAVFAVPAAPVDSPPPPPHNASLPTTELPGVVTTVPAPAGADLPADEVLVDLTVPDLAPRQVQAITRGDAVLLPVADLATHLGIRTTRHTPTLWAGMVPRESGSGSVEVVIAVPDSSEDPEAAKLVASRHGRVYADLELLRTGWNIAIAPDWASLEVRFNRVSHLPAVVVAQAAARRRAAEAQLSLARRDSSTIDRRLGFQRRLFGGAVVDYAIGVDRSATTTAPTAQLSVGAEVFGGALDLRANGSGGSHNGRVNLDGAWTFVRPTSRLLTQAKIGRLVMPGPNARSVDGLLFTNAPYVRTQGPSANTYEARFAPGWWVEVYRDGRLIAVQTVDGTGLLRMELPSTFGENVFEFVGHGPEGEQRRIRHHYRPPALLLPTGTVEYAVGVGRCKYLSCAATGSADLRVGVAAQWALQAGTDVFTRDSLSTIVTPYVGIAGAPLATPGIRALVAPAYRNLLTFDAAVTDERGWRARLWIDPSSDARLSLERRHQVPSDSTTPWLQPGQLRDEWVATTFIRPSAWFGDRAFLTGEFAHTEGPYRHSARWQIMPSASVEGVLVQPYFRWSGQLGPSAPDPQAVRGLRLTATPSSILRPVLGRGIASVTLEQRSGISGLSALIANLYVPLPGRLRLSLGSDWRAGQERPTFTMGIVADHTLVQATATVTDPSIGDPTVTTRVRGSLRWDESAGLRASAMPQQQQGDVAGVVFEDANGNGSLDAGERGIAGVQVVIGNSSAYSDSLGAYRVRGLPPYVPTLVRLDSAAVQDASVVPLYPTTEIVPTANTTTLVDLAMGPAATLEGMVRRPGSTPNAPTTPVPGLAMVAVETKTGRRYRYTTFSDGGFYVTGLPPGEYRLLVDETGTGPVWRWEPMALTVRQTPTGAMVSGIEFRVAPLPAQSTATSATTP